MQSPTAPLPARRPARKNLVLLGNVTLFALSTGVAGMCVGALVGLANYFSGPTYTPTGTGMIRVVAWWEVVRFCAVANGIFMSLLGLLVGLIMFICIGSASSRWSPERKERFFAALKARLLLPLALSIFAVSFVVTVLWCFWHIGTTSPLANSGNAIEFTGVGMLPLGACLWIWLLVRSSRGLPKEPVPIGRLLPLD